MDAVCIGEILIDWVPGSEPGTYVQHPGGAPVNVAVAMARNGLDIGFLGKVGTDSLGDFLIDTLRKENVTPLCEMHTNQAVTTMVIVSLQPDGERTFTFVRKPGADMLLREADISETTLCATRLLHAGSVSLSAEPARGATLSAMRRAKELGKLVSFDLNYRSHVWHDDSAEAERVVRGVLPYVDLLKLSQEDQAIFPAGTDMRCLLEMYGIRAVVVTYGEGGSCCMMRGCEDIHMPAVKTHAIDTTGCGDAFWGNALSYLLRKGVHTAGGIDTALMAGALRVGSLAGSLCAGQKGALASMPLGLDLT